ncbi:TPM domain-containing protein [Fibrobacter sp.]|uniref:TPM domain-containing protein n=1 Tax=Fibrobacter sp. TaxID=35828 RepID=UPI0025C2DFFE|nr:TPM domain-containing protein [Fibrobacter sp.]MBR3070524.1 TPM domain-containing protein [Fibrobacter sp.]
MQRKILTLLFVLLLAIPVAAGFSVNKKGLPKRPQNSYVYDEDRLLTKQEVQFVNELAEQLYKKAGVGLAVALIHDIGYADFRDYALKIAESWGVGGKSNEGILIFAAMKQRRRSVEVGYGAEGYLPDVLVERLQQKTIVPAFKVEKYGQGVMQLAWEIAQVVAKEKGITLDVNTDQLPQEDDDSSGLGLIIFVILFLLVAKNGGGRGNGCLWFLLGNALSNSSRGHHRGGFGGGFGGFGGGGFGGGFGGGSFGGGGSGGSW